MKKKAKKLSKNDLISQIAEILALMEEAHKNKEWIFRQIKKEKVKTTAKPSMNSFQILNQCPSEFVSHLLHILKGGDLDDLGDIASLTKTYHWFFTDIVSASNPNLVKLQSL